MRCSYCRRLTVAAVFVLASLVMKACAKHEPPVNRLLEIAGEVPRSVADWVSSQDDQLFDTQSIFDYIDGHAEVYLAYSMQQSFARRYSGPGSDVVLDVFEMASAEDAFGVFTYDLDGDDVGIGQGSRFRYGWLSFWKGPFFVSIYADGEGSKIEEAVLDLAGSVATAIPEIGELPPIVAQLPERGLDSASLRYLYHSQILATHTSIPISNPLGIAADTPTVLARYDRSGRKARVLLVLYPDLTRAEAALRSADEYLHNNELAVAGVSDSEEPFGARLDGKALRVVLEADDRTIVDELLAATPKENGP